ncbi:Gfo/Idh/MocA family protein [Actinomadura chokoriensis]|uniref:Gfo/Idh/MocA family oxidoreductase n=1 Tax=Actinomadura chokoriensis TaxID=454156 RepID=A0ABV4R3D2_9ACTN
MTLPDRAGAVRVGVLGCASIAWRRALPAFEAHPLTTVVAIASRAPDKARRFADRFGGEPVGYSEVLERADVDAVYVALPAGLHYRWTAAALDAGKHVLAEKPLTTGPGGTMRLASLAANRMLLLRENVMFLHHGQHRRVRDLVRSGRLGEIREFDSAFCIPALPRTDIRYSPELGGGALNDLAIYPLRAAQLFLGTDVDVVGACLRRDRDTDVDVSGTALLVSAGGVPATVRFGIEHAYGSWYALWGDRARLRLDRAFTPPPSRRPVVEITGQDGDERVELPAEDQFVQAVGAFAEDVLAGRTGLDDEATIRTAELVETIRRIADCRSASAG